MNLFSPGTQICKIEKIKSCTPESRKLRQRPSKPDEPFDSLRNLKSVQELHNIRRSPDLEALKLWKGLSGWLV